MAFKKPKKATMAVAKALAAQRRATTVSVVANSANHIALSVRRFDPATKALLPPETQVPLEGDKGKFLADVGAVYVVKYYFLGGKKASIELSAKTDAQRPGDDPIAKLPKTKTAITTDLGFNMGYWRVPTEGEIK